MAIMDSQSVKWGSSQAPNDTDVNKKSNALNDMSLWIRTVF